MTRRVKSGNQQIRAFEDSLIKILGPENFPRETLGDLSLLLDTLRRVVSLLTGLMELRKSFERDPAAKLHELEILLSDHVRMILKDLLPSLRTMTKKAYSLHQTVGSGRKTKRLLEKIEKLQRNSDAAS